MRKQSTPTRRPARRRTTSKVVHWYSRAINVLAAASLAALIGVLALARSDEAGSAGVVGTFANDTPLSCGGRYDAAQPGLFHPSLPCGTWVKVANPATGAETIVAVIGNDVPFAPGGSKVADVSVHTAETLGLNTSASFAQPIVLRALVGPVQGVKGWVPMIPALTPAVPARTSGLSKADMHALTLNLLGECAMCGEKGMVAVGQVSLNRYRTRFNGKATLNDVVYDHGEFSWTLPGKGKPPTKGEGYARARRLAEGLVNGTLSGEALAVQYAVTNRALYYYAPDVIATPYWGGRKGKLVPVSLENRKEVALYHRFFELKTRPQSPIEALLAKN